MMPDRKSNITTTVPPDRERPIVVIEPEPKDPVRQTPMMSTSLSAPTDLPIDDDDYVPSTVPELGRALQMLFSDIDEESIKIVWESAKRARERIQEREEMYMTESELRRFVRRILREAPFDLTNDDDYVTMTLPDEDMAALQRLAAQVEDDDDVKSDVDVKDDKKSRKKYVTAGNEGMSLGDIARELGYSGPSGVKNLLYRIEDKMRYFASLDQAWFREFMETLAKAYIDELKDATRGALDPDEEQFLDELLEDPDTVLRLPEFREWASSYINKVYKKKLGKMPKPGDEML